MLKKSTLMVAHVRLVIQIGSTGSRIILTLIHALKRTGGMKGIAALCIGGGEATAVAIEIL